MQFLDRPGQDMATSAKAEGLGSGANQVEGRLSHSSKTNTDQERVRVALARLLSQGAEVDASSETGHTGRARIAMCKCKHMIHINNIHIHVYICVHVFIHKHDTLAQHIALMWASRWGWTSVVGLLLSHHANVDLQNVSSARILHCLILVCECMPGRACDL